MIGFVGFHLVERSWHGGKAPSFLEELLFIGGLVFGVSLLVAGVFRLRLIRRVNQVSSRALEILHADNRTARLEEGSAGTDLAELSGAVNRLLDAADASQQELRNSERRLAVQPGADRADVAADGRDGDGQRSAADHPRDVLAHARGGSRAHGDSRITARRCGVTISFRATPVSTARASVRATCRPISVPSATTGSSPPAMRTPILEREFSTSHLTPNGIGAMLDVPLRQEDRGLGVMCIEHVGGPRPWKVDEQNFALSLANLVVVALADADRRQAVQNLAESQRARA